MRSKKVPSPEKRCQRRRKDEQQCRAARLRNSEYCFFHHPWTQHHREQVERIENLPLTEGSEIHELLAGAVRGVESGRLKAQQAYALGWLVRQLRENLPGVEKELAEHEQKARTEEEEEPEFGEPDEGAEESTEESEALASSGARREEKKAGGRKAASSPARAGKDSE